VYNYDSVWSFLDGAFFLLSMSFGVFAFGVGMHGVLEGED
jgi:hypothetical protein